MALSQREKDELELLELEQEQFEFEKMKTQMRVKEAKRSEVAVEAEENIASKKAYIGEIIEDVPIAAAQGATFGFADEAAGAIATAYQKATGDERPIKEIYEETRDAVRTKTKAARERSPVATFIAESAGAMATGGGVGGVGKTIGQGALYGFGETEEDIIEEPLGTAIDVGISATTAGALHGLGSLAGTMFTKPEQKLANQLGLEPSMVKDGLRNFEDPIGKVKDIITRLRKQKLFKGNPDRQELNKRLSSKMKESSEKLNRILKQKAIPPEERMTLSPRKVYKENVRYDPIEGSATGARKRVVTKEHIGDEGAYVPEGVWTKEMFVDDISPHLDDVRDQMHFQFGAENEKKIDKLFDTMHMEFDRPTGVDLEYINKKKQAIYKELDAAYKNPDSLDGVVTEAKEQYAKILKSFVDKHAPETKEINKIMADIHFVKNGPTRSSVALSAATGHTGDLTIPMGGPARMAVEGVKEFISEPTRTARGRIGAGVREALDVSGIGSERVLSGMQKAATVTGGRTVEGDAVGREPQSLPEQLVRFKIPRTSESVLENADMVKAKIAQQAPEMFDDIQEVLDNHPEKVGDLLPLLQTMAPHLLEDDKYGRIDGVIIDPVKKQMAREDLNLNEDLSNSQRMLMMNQLNKTGEFEL